MPKRFKSHINHFEMQEKGKATFQSYIDLEVDENHEEEKEPSFIEEEISQKEEVEKDASAFFAAPLEPKKLQGEQVVVEADSVLMFAPFTDHKQGISGHLFVTNFKISFVTADKSSYPDGGGTSSSQRNKLLDNTDIPLTSVDCVYQVASGGRRRKLLPGVTVNTSTKYLEIHCKDFQIHVFGFKFTQKDQNRQVTNAVMFHCFPAKDDLLFAFAFGHSGHFEEHNQAKFYDRSDWERELERLQCQIMWRVTDANIGFRMATSLPEYFVTPMNLLNSDISRASNQYIDRRLPTWSYTYIGNGASLIRMSQILPESDLKSLEDKVLAAVKQSSGNDKDLMVLDLGRECPSLLDIRSSHERLKQIIMSDSPKDFYTSDSHWLSNLENTRWLKHVATCLGTANKVVKLLVGEAQTVVLKEESGCDLTCLVSCLAQLQIDPEYRTINGFQSLIQREWVAMGHPFQRRLNLVHSPDVAESELAPVFLMFLDCVWQLLQQFPSYFAFTETYLTSLWDTVYIGLFETFLFNSCYHRNKFLREGRKMTIISLPSAWDWKFHLNDDQILLFNNPLYMLRTTYDLDSLVDNAKTALRTSGETLRENSYCLHLGRTAPEANMFSHQETILKPEVKLSLIKLWSQAYLRWTVPAQIVGGGNPSQYMQQCVLAEEVLCLQFRLNSLSAQVKQNTLEKQSGDFDATLRRSGVKGPRPNSGLFFGLSGNQSSGMELSSIYITSSFPFSPGVSQQTQHSLICGPLSQYLKDTAIEQGYEEDDDDDY